MIFRNQLPLIFITSNQMNLRVNELAKALDAEESDVLAICTLLKLPVTSRISSMSIENAKKVTDYYEIHKKSKSF